MGLQHLVDILLEALRRVTRVSSRRAGSENLMRRGGMSILESPLLFRMCCFAILKVSVAREARHS